MDRADVRETVLRAMDELSDEQLMELLRNVQAMQQSGEQRPSYDPEKDTMLKYGLFSGDPDLAERSSEILRAELGLRKSRADE